MVFCKSSRNPEFSFGSKVNFTLNGNHLRKWSLEIGRFDWEYKLSGFGHVERFENMKTISLEQGVFIKGNTVEQGCSI